MTVPEPCPRCGRPVALARASCIYCGAALRPDQVTPAATAAAARAAPDSAAPAPARDVVVLDMSGATAEALASSLGIPAYEAGQRILRGGYQLHRVLPPEPAAAEAERLRAAGLPVIVVSETGARAAAVPHLALGGDFEDGAFVLRTDSGPRRVTGSELLLVVRGPIARAAEPQSALRRVRVAGPSEGQRVHLHLRTETRPLEIDPEDFECGPAPLPRSSLLALAEWIRGLGRETPVDEGFRYLAPALSPALPPRASPSAAAEALRPAAPARGRPALFDNVPQFRFYSGWRAAVERARPEAVAARVRGTAS